MKFFQRYFLSVLAILFITACDTGNNVPPDASINEPPAISEEEYAVLENYLILPRTAYDYAGQALPSYFNENPLDSTDNAPSPHSRLNELATLGRVLFYDKNLSINNTISCSSCHLQSHGFSDPEQFSKGFNGGLTRRNSMGLANARYFADGSFFWDMRAATLTEQVLLPIEDIVEMGISLDSLERKLQKLDYYPILFRQAFDDTIVSRERIASALANFIRTIISYRTKFDSGVVTLGRIPTGTSNIPGFTAQENRGFRDFISNRCNRCHHTAIQIAKEPANIGLDIKYDDNGLGEVTGNRNDEGKFKVPSLRNIALTAPYMHDGRFATLEEVVNFYNDEIQPHENLHPEFGGPNNPIPTDADVEDIIAFMKTLTDSALMIDEKFANPFKVAKSH